MLWHFLITTILWHPGRMPLLLEVFDDDDSMASPDKKHRRDVIRNYTATPRWSFGCSFVAHLSACMTGEKQSVLYSVRVAMTVNSVDSKTFWHSARQDSGEFQSFLSARGSSLSVHCYPFLISSLVHPCLQGWGGCSTLLCVQGKNHRSLQ